MHPLLIMLAVAIPLAPHSGGRTDSPFDGTTILKRVIQMEPAAQQRWLKRIESRCSRACKLALPARDAVKERAKVHALLRQTDIPMPVLLDLLEQLDVREQTAIDRLARRYHLQTSRTFSGQGAARDRRRGAWYEAFAAWEEAGRPFEQQDWLIGWLQLATANLTLEKIGPIPSIPPFGSFIPPTSACHKRPLASVSFPTPEVRATSSEPHSLHQPLQALRATRRTILQPSHSVAGPSAIAWNRPRGAQKPLPMIRKPKQGVVPAPPSIREPPMPDVSLPLYGAQTKAGVQRWATVWEPLPASAETLPSAGAPMQAAAACRVVLEMLCHDQGHGQATREPLPLSFATRIPQDPPSNVIARQGEGLQEVLLRGLGSLPVSQRATTPPRPGQPSGPPTSRNGLLSAPWWVLPQGFQPRPILVRASSPPAASLRIPTPPAAENPEPATVTPASPQPEIHASLTAGTGIRYAPEVPPDRSLFESRIDAERSPALLAKTISMRRHVAPPRVLDAGGKTPRPARTTAGSLLAARRLGHTLRPESRGIYLVSLGSIGERFAPPPRTPEPWTPQVWQSEPVEPMHTDSTSGTFDVPRRSADAARLFGRPVVMRPALRFPSLEPPAAASPASETPATPRVQINLGELAAQIAGSNLNLRALEAKLRRPGNWDARRLTLLVDKLEILVIRQSDLGTFRAMVSQQDRALVGWLESPRGAIAEASARLFETRDHVSGPKFTGTETQRRTELQQLNKLSTKLVELATRK